MRRSLRSSLMVIRSAMLVAAACAVVATEASAADPTQRNPDPWAQFRSGYRLYSDGDKDGALAAYAKAAEDGHAGAQWKVARMYADGDGIAQDDYRAFKMFQKIVDSGVTPGSQEEIFVSDALVALARYYRRGIANTEVRANPAAAMDLYIRAASIYGNTQAQFEIGHMLLDEHRNLRRAARWLQLASDKGHVGAQALLGDLLFQKGRTVEGLAMLTTALNKASEKDRGWIRQRQEQAFGLASEAERRLAYEMSRHQLGEVVVSAQ
ncbi:tetratricopeptide repeat protein [Notoacmeibacter sp. MSK16QG-6]|uniref:tetratricopeptide repeat protein n=1 Tax=Notoacmeibacter sp. MSK16QG-6 TaxID=2957982 RepID=UPI00209FA3E6|nr:tetratricopeptide repeat protein [Notoacmeibacter sp. MSK16QG-6]MCP1199398.1 sel1 repeat family protein [Notoacmeibacter sp. MSK16QG-6]